MYDFRSQLTLETPIQPQCLSQVFATREFSKKSSKYVIHSQNLPIYDIETFFIIVDKQELVNENKNLTFDLEEYQRYALSNICSS